MKVNFKKYDTNKPLLNKPDVGDICLCECGGFCQEGVITAEYTSEGFVFSGHGNIDQYVTGLVVLDF